MVIIDDDLSRKWEVLVRFPPILKIDDQIKGNDKRFMVCP